MNSERIKIIVERIKDTEVTVSTKVSASSLYNGNHTFNGDINFNKNPSIKQEEVKTTTENDERYLTFISRSKEIFSTTVASNSISSSSTHNIYRVSGVSGNFSVDFSSYTFETDTRYEFVFEIDAYYFVTELKNIVVGEYTYTSRDVFNLSTGAGTNVLQTIIIMTTETGYNIYSSSMANITQDVLMSTSTVDDDPETSTTGKTLFNFTDFAQTKSVFSFTNLSTSNQLTNTIVTGVDRLIDATSSGALFLKCSVNATIGGIQKTGTYFIPMYSISEDSVMPDY